MLVKPWSLAASTGWVWSRRPSGMWWYPLPRNAFMMVARMVARLTGPRPVLLVEASSPKETSRIFSGGPLGR